MKRIIWGITASLLAAGSANAALQGRLPATVGGMDYQAYYDDELDITWLADANLTATNTFGVTLVNPGGYMDWYAANEWIAAMNTADYLGVNNWRLPLTAQPDASCLYQYDGVSLGTGCTGSEMGHLYYVDGVTSSSPGVFSNVLPVVYWSDTTYAPYSSLAWYFHFIFGEQLNDSKSYSKYAWAVHPGDIGAVVPVPAAVWLMASALGALGALRWRTGRGTEQAPPAAI